MEPEDQELDTTELQDSLNNEDTALDDDGTGVALHEYDDDGNPIEVSQTDTEPNEADPTQAEASAPFRPTFQPRNVAEAEAYLNENVDAGTLNALRAVMDAQYANARGGETIADHYINQIEQAAPGFITAQERTFIRGMAPQQQSDPGSIVFAAFMRPIQKATQTGNTVEAIDEICADWLKRRGKTVAKPAITPLPPSQRVGGASGGGGGTVTRPVSKQSGGGGSLTSNYLSGLGFDKTEARELERKQGVQSGR